MAIQAAVPRETAPGERRVAIVPRIAKRLRALSVDLWVEPGAGLASGMPDAAYADCATLENDGHRLYGEADIVLRVGLPEAEQISAMREGSILVSFVYGNRHPERVRLLCEKKITSFAMELVPRISRAQSLDALSSQALVAGYKAVLLAASRLERFFPMLTTAAGTIRPAKVLVIGAGVAGLQAIATAHRLGAQVEAYDVRAASREEVESLGARFVSTEIHAESEGGYARELTEEERRLQQETLAQHVRQADVVISTASIPGRPAPKIILKPMVDAMKPGSVIVDLAAEGGGNCELTEPGQEVQHGQTSILGPLNVPSMLAEDASGMYAQNVLNLLSLFVREGRIELDWGDEVISKTALTHGGELRHDTPRRLSGGGPNS
ncbi:MAG: Re/Si-specific NAD(P)(+) transhydrogenase subunit alpha [Terriglobia bacterium]